jgi:predicted nucleotidyltransferase
MSAGVQASAAGARGSGRRGPAPGVLEEAVRRVVAASEPERIVVFGSSARGEMGPDSDVDLLVIKRDVHRKRAVAAEILRALRGLPEAFDVIVATPEEIERYGESPALVFRQALREGKTLYVA